MASPHPPEEPGLQRNFLGWDRPLVELACERLMASGERSSSGGWLDASGLLVVVPTRQSGRRLRRTLAAAAADEGLGGVLPPVVVPPEYFLDPASGKGLDGGPSERPPAPPIVMELAWAEVLRTIDLARYPAFLPVEPPERNLAWAVQVASGIEAARAALAEGGMLVRDLVARGKGGIPAGDEEESEGAVQGECGVRGAAASAPGRPLCGLPEAERWRDLAALEDRMRDVLRRRGWDDRQEARIRCSRRPKVPESTRRLIIVGVPDPAPLAVEAWRALSRRLPVEVWVHAPEEEYQAFDEWGRPDPDRWSGRVIDLDRPGWSLRSAMDPRSLGAEVVALLRERSDAGEKAVCVSSTDRGVSAATVRALEEADISVFDPEGEPLALHALSHLLRLTVDLVRDNRFRTAAALFRCPLVFDALRRGFRRAGESEPVSGFARRLGSACDQLHVRNLPSSLDDGIGLLRSAPEAVPDGDLLAHGLRELSRLRRSFLRGELGVGVRDLFDFLLRGTRHDARDPGTRRLVAVVEAVHARVEQVERFVAGAAGGRAGAGGAADDLDAGAADAADLLDQVVRGLGTELFYPERRGEDLDLVGWLEVPWDDAPDLVLTGFHDGAVPESLVGDPFLPASLRESLGLRGNAERLARDAYLLEAACRWRAAKGGCVHVLFARVGEDGAPLRPSRLLFQCEDEALPHRVLRLLGGVGEDTTRAVESVPAWHAGWKLRADAGLRGGMRGGMSGETGEGATIEEAVPLPSPLRVTDFRLYLECPFRFYLRRVRRMEPIESGKREMDARDFGNLCHRAMEDFARDEEVRESADPVAIGSFLKDSARRAVEERYGRRPPVPVRLQLESAVQRLLRAAEVQAGFRHGGWRIEHVELPFGKESEWTIGGVPVAGTIDRVDRHEGTGILRILDYKSSSRAEGAEEAHAKSVQRARLPDGLPDWRILPDDGGKRCRYWTNLQLPLYALWLRQHLAAPDAAIEVGYFNLPASLEQVGVAPWPGGGSPELLASARACAADVVEAMLARVFWPPARRVKYDGFLALAAGLPLAELVDPGSLDWTLRREEVRTP